MMSKSLLRNDLRNLRSRFLPMRRSRRYAKCSLLKIFKLLVIRPNTPSSPHHC